MSELTGWLMDLYEIQDGLALWFLSDSGRRLRLRQRFPVTFYASGPPDGLRALWRFLRALPVEMHLHRGERLDPFSGEPVTVLAVEVLKPGEQPGVFRQASEAFPRLSFADADLPVWLRYAAAYGVFPLARCRAKVDGEGRVMDITALDSPWDVIPERPPLRTMELEPDCDPAHATPRRLHVRAGGCAYCFSLAPARALLVNLAALLRRYDPDLLLTRWGDTWLLPRLLEQSHRLEIPLPLNREQRLGIGWRRARTYFSYGQIVYRGEQVHLFGRWHLDRSNAMLWDDYDLEGVFEAARVTTLPVQTAARVSPGGGISSIEMLTALRKGILVPWQKQQPEMFKPASDLFSADQGGLVYQPVVGLHRNVAGVDFTSMYPAIMVHFNISPETLHTGDAGGEWVPEVGLRIDRDRPGLIPAALKPLLEKRLALKRLLAELPEWDPRRERCKRRVSALKWLLVTCFGYLGYKNARFGRIEAHQAVTAYGRELLLGAKEAAEDLGYEVLHLYVDGMWIRQEGHDRPEDFQPLLDEIERRTGLQIALEGVYRWVAFLPSRMRAGCPVANRYFGVFQDGTMKVRGIEARRRDTPGFIAETQMELLRCLAMAEEPETALPAALGLLRRRLADLSAGRAPLEGLILKQRLTRELNAYRSPSPAAWAARQLQEVGKTIRPGQRVRFIYTRGRPGVRAWDLPDPPDPLLVDVERYRRLTLRAAAAVLEPFGAGETSLQVWASGGATQPRLKQIAYVC